MNVRDFIYLDNRRVLSFGSQLLEGFTNAISVNKVKENVIGKEIQTKAEVHGKLSIGEESSKLLNLLVGMIGKGEIGLTGEVNPLFSSSKTVGEEKTEHRLLDHYQFTLLRNALIEQKLLKDLDIFKPNEWSSGKVIERLRPGDFIELTCRVKLLDVAHLESIANAVENLFETIQQMTLVEKAEEKYQAGESLERLVEELNETPITIGYENMKKVLGGSINPLQFNAILDLMKKISKEGYSSIPVQIIARPKQIANSGTKFIAPIREEYLIDTKDEIIFKYGYEPEQDWRLLGQICKIPKNKKRDKVDFTKFNNSNFQALDRILEELTDSFMDLSLDIGMHSFVKYPDVSINLIALYR